MDTPQITYDFSSGSPVDNLIRDLVVFTVNDAFSEAEILTPYGFTFDDLYAMRQHPQFQQRWSHHKREMGDDRTAVIRAQAKLLTEASLRTLFETINNPDEKTGDKLKAFALLSEMADMKPRNDPAALNSGVVVNLSFGSMTPHAQATIDNNTGEIVDGY